jgi:hypothetical protein
MGLGGVKGGVRDKSGQEAAAALEVAEIAKPPRPRRPLATASVVSTDSDKPTESSGEDGDALESMTQDALVQRFRRDRAAERVATASNGTRAREEEKEPSSGAD